MKLLLLLFCLRISSAVFSQQGKIENLAFEGAGIRGIAYRGVLKEMEKNGILKNVERVAGTSAGAITALMIALGYTPDDVYQLISNTKFQKFNDGRFLFFGGMARLKNKFGWYRGVAFTNWLEKIIIQKTGYPDITFKQLPSMGFKKLYITGTSLTQQKLIVFSAEN